MTHPPAASGVAGLHEIFSMGKIYVIAIVVFKEKKKIQTKPQPMEEEKQKHKQT